MHCQMLKLWYISHPEAQGGQASDIKIVAEQILYIKDKLNKILSENTGQPIEIIKNDTERDRYMSAEEAVKYGLIDKVIEHRQK